MRFTSLAIAFAIFSASTLRPSAGHANDLPCGTAGFREIGETVGKISAASVPREITEIATWTAGIRKLQERAHFAFWTGTPADRERALRASAEAGEISKQFRDDMTRALHGIEENNRPREKEEIYRVLSLPNERAVATLLRISLQTGGTGNELGFLPGRVAEVVASRCSQPPTRQCEAAAFETLVGSDRRAITEIDRNTKLQLTAGQNFQVVESTRMSAEDANVIATYLKEVEEIRVDKTGKLNVTHDRRTPPPAALTTYFDKMMASVREADPDATVEFVNVIHRYKGEAQTPYAHFDGGPAMQVLTTFEGAQTWVRAADGRFFQVPQIGDTVLILTKGTDHPTAHLSPMDFDSERVLLRFIIRSTRFARKVP